MYVKLGTNKTAGILADNTVVVTTDDGFDTIVDFRQPCDSRSEAEAFLAEIGYRDIPVSNLIEKREPIDAYRLGPASWALAA